MKKPNPLSPTDFLNHQQTSTSSPNNLTDYPPHPFISAYGPKRKIALSFTPPGRTKQGFKAECDINTIMNMYAKTGVLPHVTQRAPTYQDVEGLDFQAAMDIVVGAQAMFNDLPSALRDRFANDPGRLLAFLQNPENRQEAIKLGLLNAEVAPLPPHTPPAENAGKPPSGQLEGNPKPRDYNGPQATIPGVPPAK